MSNLIPIYVEISDLPRIQKILYEVGFHDFALQTWKEKQIWGLAKDISQDELIQITGNLPGLGDFPDLQYHIRAYSDGRLEAEIEIHRFDLRHLWSCRPSAHNQIASILYRYNIQFRIGSPNGPEDSFESFRDFPKNEAIDWPLYLAVAGLIAAFVEILSSD